jgi:hypothetical protein
MTKAVFVIHIQLSDLYKKQQNMKVQKQNQARDLYLNLGLHHLGRKPAAPETDNSPSAITFEDIASSTGKERAAGRTQCNDNQGPKICIFPIPREIPCIGENDKINN